MSIKHMTTYLSRSPEETMKIARQLVQGMDPGTILYLFGELGSGKTVFVKGLCEGLGVKEVVTSPSFVIATEYEGRMPVSHIDLYRLQPNEVLDLHLEDYLLAHGVSVIEWADRLNEFEDRCIRVMIKIAKRMEREIVIEDTRN